MRSAISLCCCFMTYALIAQDANVGLAKITRKLEEEIACEAVKRGLTERGDVQDRLRNLRRQILVQALKEDMLRAIPEPTEAEINTGYQLLKKRWMVPEAYKVDAVEMRVLSPDLAQKAEAMVTGKAISDNIIKPFLENAVVTQKSGNWIIQKNVASQVWKQLSEMIFNEVRIINTPTGKILIRKGQYQKADILPLDKVRLQVKQAIKQQKFEKIWNQYLKQLKVKVLKEKKK